MGQDDSEERLLRSVALRNANSILLARQRAERELLEAKEALERKTQELAQSLAMTRATLEATSNAIVVTDANGTVTGFNQNFIELWRLPAELMVAGEHRRVLEFNARQFREPEKFRARIEAIYATSPAETFDILELADGRVFERFTRIQYVEERNVGRVWSFRDITERKRAEQELQQQREWFQVTLSSIGDAVITTDTLGRVTFLNPVAEVLTGWKSSEACGRTLQEVFNIINEETRAPATNPVDKVLREGIAVALANHTALISKDGTERGIEDSAAPIRDAVGKVCGAVMVFHDVTERRRTQKALRESEDRLRAVFNQAAVGIAIAGLSGRFEQVNQKFSEILGYSPEECCQMSFSDITHPDDLAETQANVARLREGEIGDYAIEKRYVRKDGAVIWSLTTVTLLKDAAGRPSRFVGAIDDISQRKKAEEALRESEEMHRVFFELGSVGMAYVSPNGRFLKVNEKFCEITGYSAQELAQLTTLALTHPDDRQNEREQAARYIRENLPVHKSEKRYIRKDGSARWVSVAARMVHGPDGAPRYSIGIVEDITERKRAEAELQETDRRKDEFLAILAHELRNPLAPIRNGLKVLTLAANNPVMAEKARGMMDLALNQMIRLVDDLLDASRITTGKLQLRKERTQLAAVVQSAVETSRPAIDERAQVLTVTLPSVPISLDADPTRLAQVFANLLNNAAKYSEPGGRIGLCAERQGDWVVVRIRDTGIGIAPEHLPRIFDMFAQLDTGFDRSQGGLGIGLSLVKALVEMHGGTIQAKSAGAGLGSEFIVSLPAADSEPRAGLHVTDTREVSDHATRRHRILVVDDNRLSSDSAAIALRLMGHEIVNAYDGIEAIEVAQTFRPDVVLLDIGLPKLNGYETARRMRAQSWGQEMFLIALTGYGQEADRRRSFEAGFNYHMVKPVNFSELEKKLAELGSA
jgi:PAS domain S-box-containing protein